MRAILCHQPVYQCGTTARISDYEDWTPDIRSSISREQDVVQEETDRIDEFNERQNDKKRKEEQDPFKAQATDSWSSKKRQVR
jgi:hypothetical protein